MGDKRAGCRGLRPLPGFGAAPQIPVPQHNRRKRCERPKGRKKRGMLQSAACPSRPSASHPASVASGPKAARNAAGCKTRHAPHAPAPHPASVASGPKAARNAASRKARHAPHAPAPLPASVASGPKAARNAASRKAPLSSPNPRTSPQSPPAPPPPSIT